MSTEGAGNGTVLGTLLKLLETRSSQYGTGWLQSLLVHSDKSGWENRFTRVRMMRPGDEPVGENLDYGGVLYVSAGLNIDEVRRFIERLAEQPTKPYEIRCVPITFCDPVHANRYVFRSGDFLNRWHHYAPEEWPTSQFVFDGLASRSLPHDPLVRDGQPLYPDPFHLVHEKFGFDIGQRTVQLGTVEFQLPNYQARIADIQVSGPRTFVAVETTPLLNIELVGKFYATDAADGTHKFHTDFPAEAGPKNLDTGFVSDQVDVALVQVGDSGEMIDHARLASWDLATQTVTNVFESDSLSLVIQQGEGPQIELKPTSFKDRDKNEIAESAVAFANTNGGVIVIGVTDRGEITGAIEEANPENVGRVIADRTEPPLEVDARNVVLDDVRVCVVYLPRGDNRPYSLRDRGIFVRRGANDRQITRAELDEIYRQRRFER